MKARYLTPAVTIFDENGKDKKRLSLISFVAWSIMTMACFTGFQGEREYQMR